MEKLNFAEPIEVKEEDSDYEEVSWMTVEFNGKDHKKLKDGQTLVFKDKKGNRYLVHKAKFPKLKE